MENNSSYVVELKHVFFFHTLLGEWLATSRACSNMLNVYLSVAKLAARLVSILTPPDYSYRSGCPPFPPLPPPPPPRGAPLELDERSPGGGAGMGTVAGFDDTLDDDVAPPLFMTCPSPPSPSSSSSLTLLSFATSASSLPKDAVRSPNSAVICSISRNKSELPRKSSTRRRALETRVRSALPPLSTAPDTTKMEVMVPSPYYLQSTVMAADAAMLPPQRTTSKEEKERNYTEHLNKDTTCTCH